MEWTYDDYGRVFQKYDADSVKILEYGYDANGALTSRWSKAKGYTYYSYDAVGNLQTVDYPASTDISYDYDAVNQLTNMTDAVGTTSFTYTDNGKIKTEDGPWSNDSVTYAYNDADRLSQVAVPRPGETDWTQDFGYDNSRRLDTITAPEGTYTYHYKGAGKRIQQVNYPIGSYVTNQFDSVARLKDTEMCDSSGTILREHEYNYNQGNQREQQTRTDASYVDYTYDRRGRTDTVTHHDFDLQQRKSTVDRILFGRDIGGTLSGTDLQQRSQARRRGCPDQQHGYFGKGRLCLRRHRPACHVQRCR